MADIPAASAARQQNFALHRPGMEGLTDERADRTTRLMDRDPPPRMALQYRSRSLPRWAPELPVAARIESADTATSLAPVHRECSWMLAVLSSVERRCRVLRTSVATLPHDSAKSCHQFWSRAAQFVVMMQRQFGEHSLSLGSESEEDFAAIVLRPRAMDKSSSLQTVHQFHRTVVADFHTTGQFADSRAHVRRHALDGQHQLVLASFQTCLLYHLLAETKETSNLVTELRQCLIV